MTNRTEQVTITITISVTVEPEPDPDKAARRPFEPFTTTRRWW